MYPDNLKFADETLTWYNEGRSISWMLAKSEEMGRKLSQGALSRHRRHLDEVEADENDQDMSGGSVDHLKVLEKMIQSGARRASTWRIGPAETLKAMDMYYKLTQGSAMRDLFAALTAVASGEDPDDVGEVDAGSFSPAELESVDADVGTP